MHVNCSSVKEYVGQIKNSQIFFLLVQAIHERLQKGPSNAFVKCFNIVHTFQTVLLMDRTRKKTSFYLILTPLEYYKRRLCFITTISFFWQIVGTKWRHCPCHSPDWHGNKHYCLECRNWKGVFCYIFCV